MNVFNCNSRLYTSMSHSITPRCVSYYTNLLYTHVAPLPLIELEQHLLISIAVRPWPREYFRGRYIIHVQAKQRALIAMLPALPGLLIHER